MAAPDRAPSVSSSSSEAYDEKKHSSDGSIVNIKAGEGSEAGDDVERAELLPEDHEEEKPAAPTTENNSTRTAVMWMVVNTLATIGIVRSATLAYSPRPLTSLLSRSSRIRPSFLTLP
jgi:solute carrier family 35 protein E3